MSEEDVDYTTDFETLKELYQDEECVKKINGEYDGSRLSCITIWKQEPTRYAFGLNCFEETFVEFPDHIEHKGHKVKLLVARLGNPENPAE